MITRAILIAEQARLAARREQLVADLNGVIGAEQEVGVLLGKLEKIEAEAAANAPAATNPEPTAT